MLNNKYDEIICGSGCSGLFCALNLPSSHNILVISKAGLEDNDSFLAQGGICVKHDDNDFEDFYNDTMKAGHNENSKEAVTEMIERSREIINDLVNLGVDFERNPDGSFKYTREGAHSKPRILFHEDITGKAITSTLLAVAKTRKNITLVENTTLLDILEENNRCAGCILLHEGKELYLQAKNVIMACGGVGGLYQNSTNFPELTGDALAISKMHNVTLEHIDYVQIHPTTLYSTKKGRRFLISESVRGEGALLLNENHERFTCETLARDVVTKNIRAEMKKFGTKHVWLDMKPLGEKEILNHFPNIRKACLDEGYDPLTDLIPVVPAQHYFMGGVKVDLTSHTSMDNLYCVGEAACNGVHGKNRLASNSLLESLVFAKNAAKRISDDKVEFMPLPNYKYDKARFDRIHEEIKKQVKGEEN